jgi:hypothetical protein
MLILILLEGLFNVIKTQYKSKGILNNRSPKNKVICLKLVKDKKKSAKNGLILYKLCKSLILKDKVTAKMYFIKRGL